MRILSKFKIDYHNNGANIAQEPGWLTAHAEKTETPTSLTIEYIPNISGMDKGIISSQDAIVGGLIVVVTVLALIFFIKTAIVFFAGQVDEDEKKLMYVLPVVIIIGGLLSKHFFTKAPETNITNIEFAKTAVSRDGVEYSYKVNGMPNSWREPLSNYGEIIVKRETIFRSSFVLSGPGLNERVEVNVIYLSHKHDSDKNIPLEIVQINENVAALASSYENQINTFRK